MKVHQIISDSQVDEANPIDWIKKKFGSKTAATKMDIDAETKALTKDFEAYYKNTQMVLLLQIYYSAFLKRRDFRLNNQKIFLLY